MHQQTVVDFLHFSITLRCAATPCTVPCVKSLPHTPDGLMKLKVKRSTGFLSVGAHLPLRSRSIDLGCEAWRRKGN
uniref:Putative secreted protein n=1 Tax=Anopheles marajoara TaxID=58244 RepID=A0A2M4CCL8_9DIPT